MKLIINEKPVFNEKPWLTNQAIIFLDDFLKKHNDISMLEFGSGSSTLWFSKRIKQLISIEHDERWYNYVQQELVQQKIKNVDYRLIKSDYYKLCETLPKNHFDIILVDGKDRMQCMEYAIPILKSCGILMLDNAERSQYKPIYKTLKDWRCSITRTTSPRTKQTNWWIKPT